MLEILLAQTALEEQDRRMRQHQWEQVALKAKSESQKPRKEKMHSVVLLQLRRAFAG